MQNTMQKAAVFDEVRMEVGMGLHSLLLVMFLAGSSAYAQMVEVPEEKPKEKAAEYFKARQEEAPAKAAPVRSVDGAPRFLALHVGTYLSDQAYAWGVENHDDVGRFNAGVDYRMGEWVNTMDWAMRIDYSSYSLDGEGSARKLSIGAILTFPDVNSGFPLYFGVGAGAGFFIKQLDDESPLALDYSLLLGARFHNVIGSTGLMIETGLKNHLLAFSDGQFNGVYVNVGTIHSF